MSLQTVKDSVGSAVIGGVSSFCATAFASATYGIGYILTNWLGASTDLSIVAGVVTMVGLGSLTLLGGTASALAGGAVASETMNIKEGRVLPSIAGVGAGIYAGFKAAAVVGSLLTFDRGVENAQYAPIEKEATPITLKI